MREIKFRAWDKKKKEFFVPFIEPFDEYSLSIRLDGTLEMFNSEPYGGEVEEGRFELMQYIGHKDVDDKEIFESDILEDDYHVICPVFWDDLETGFRMKSERDWWKCKVVGNIYENPGLLKGNK
jgi:hypothetical protein